MSFWLFMILFGGALVALLQQRHENAKLKKDLHRRNTSWTDDYEPTILRTKTESRQETEWQVVNPTDEKEEVVEFSAPHLKFKYRCSK